MFARHVREGNAWEVRFPWLDSFRCCFVHLCVCSRLTDRRDWPFANNYDGCNRFLSLRSPHPPPSLVCVPQMIICWASTCNLLLNINASRPTIHQTLESRKSTGSIPFGKSASVLSSRTNVRREIRSKNEQTSLRLCLSVSVCLSVCLSV